VPLVFQVFNHLIDQRAGFIGSNRNFHEIPPAKKENSLYLYLKARKKKQFFSQSEKNCFEWSTRIVCNP
jgi:hypothetical protein